MQKWVADVIATLLTIQIMRLVGRSKLLTKVYVLNVVFSEQQVTPEYFFQKSELKASLKKLICMFYELLRNRS